jgi:hypothetical protein
VNAALDIDVISKGEFARRRGVSAGRVSQWLSEGKITADAIVGEGRSAQIRESVACAQLRQRLDPMQMTANGLSTQLGGPPASLAAPTAVAPAPGSDMLPLHAPASAGSLPLPPLIESLEEKIKRQRLEQLERDNRKGVREEAIAAGMLTDAAAAKALVGRATSQLITTFEGALSEFATAISAEWQLPQRDVLHLLRTKFREVRAGAASAARAQAEQLPDVVDYEFADSDHDETEAA